MAENTSRTSGNIALGRQMTIEFYDCKSSVLTDAARMEKVFLYAAELSGAHVVNSVFHSFEPQGVSGVVVISESHFAVHAWPEHDYAAVDLFTCGDGVDFDLAVKALAEGMNSGYWIISSLVNRGILGENGVERLVPVVENGSAHGLQLSWKARYEHTCARAMSSCIDIYGCTKIKLDNADELKIFAGKIVDLLAEKSSEQYEWGCSANADELEFACSFDRGHLSGFTCPERSGLYLDIFTAGFFDPRTIAEFSMNELGGQYYR
ncbi:MAG: adenosylmethionine decarboxylase, partial [Lentisphaeria bacterium]|nr:adenosylmethionine decarboxylase [Lentisphaeria bacterium]